MFDGGGYRGESSRPIKSASHPRHFLLFHSRRGTPRGWKAAERVHASKLRPVLGGSARRQMLLNGNRDLFSSPPSALHSTPFFPRRHPCDRQPNPHESRVPSDLLLVLYRGVDGSGLFSTGQRAFFRAATLDHSFSARRIDESSVGGLGCCDMASLPATLWFRRSATVGMLRSFR